ncbi:hypothetical protein OA163_00735 [bacterium]|nr:hypothetical protein [bacterium]
MASYIVDSSQVLSATTGADSVWLQSGGHSSTIYGLAGNDTITVEQVSNASSIGSLIYTNDGADSIDIESANFSAAGIEVRAGAGSDTVSISGGTIALVNTNEDNDLISVSGNATISAATFSTGADSLFMQSGSIDQLGLGNGHDIFTGGTVQALTGASIKLGDGRDTISVASLTGASAITLYGDNGSNANSDVIDLSTQTGMNGFVVKGRGGSDTINISGLQASSIVQGNDGADSIALSAEEALTNGLEIGGGKGDDTIYIAGDSGGWAVGVSGDIFGGAGNDSIYFVDHLTSSGDATALNINAGAGADTITFNFTTSGFGGELGTLNMSSLSDSTLTAMDLVVALSGNSALKAQAFSGAALFTVDFGNSAVISSVGATSAAADFDNATAYATIDASGIVTFNGDLATDVQSSVTAAMEAVDTLTFNNGGEGAAAYFVVGDEDYLFMQGGSEGTADDSIMKFSAGSAHNISIQGSAVVFNFSGI